MSFTGRLAARARSADASLTAVLRHPFSDAEGEPAALEDTGERTVGPPAPAAIPAPERPLPSTPALASGARVSLPMRVEPVPSAPPPPRPKETPASSPPPGAVPLSVGPRGSDRVALPQSPREPQGPVVVRELRREVHHHDRTQERVIERHHHRSTHERTERFTLQPVRAVRTLEPPLPRDVPAPRRSPVATSVPPVHVHIGRIIVGAEPARPPRPPPRRAAGPAMKTLAEHLSERGRGRR